MTELPKYVFAKKINGTDLEGVMEISTMKLLCVCNEENSKVIISAFSDRDQFAIGFAEWIGTDECPFGVADSENDNQVVTKYLDLYKQSLTKTDKK